MNRATRKKADGLYLLLATLFVTALIVCNLIANKFVTVDLGFKTFILSAGVLPYPITFLVTDILSEIYGKRKTNQVVLMGFAALVFTLAILWLGSRFPSIAESPVSDELYQTAYGNSWRVIMSSMVAYIIAQLVDVRLFHFWKKLTGGRYLWLRNNASTVVSQLVDTTLVVVVLFAGTLSWEQIGGFVRDGWMFKSLAALADTPVLYFCTWLIRKRLKLKFAQEVAG
ncbi:MAG: queuosine precursor transporter [Cryomorphaceae bacterium]